MHKSIWAQGMLLIALLLLAAACGGRATPVVIQQGAAQTEAAATAFFQGQTATAAAALLPTRTPTPTGTPYIRPTDDPAVAPETVIATVAGHDITVAEFRNRVRYQRWSALETLRRIAVTSGISAIDIRDPQNPMTPTVIGYLYTLSNAETFAESILEMMIQERIMHQEFIERRLEPNPGLLNNLWARTLDIPVAGDGALPEGFEAALDAYMTTIRPYTDLTEVELRFMLTVQSEQQALAIAVGDEVEFDPQALNIRQIVVSSETEAQEIIALLENGADFNALARERSIDPAARGNGGDLGFISRGETVAEFEAAAFAAEPGEVVGPVQTEYGYHLIEVLEREDEVRVRQLLLPTEEEAQAALERLNSGEDFAALAQELTADPQARQSGGDLGYIGRGDMPAAVEEPLFAADVGELVGPVRTSAGYHILQVTERRAARVHVRHILLATAEEAQAALERLNAGEDFADLANELSIDPQTQGDGGEKGLLTRDQLPASMAEALYAANTGDIVGPLEVEGNYYVVQVTDRQLNVLSPEQYDELKGLHFQNWLREETEAVEINEVWRRAYPSDPQPGDVAPYLADMEAAMNEAMAAFATPTPAVSG